MQRKKAYIVYDEPHKNIKLLMEDTRMPIKKGQTKAFPTAKEHFKLTSKWVNTFTVMESRANDTRFKTQREFFDRPVTRPLNSQKTNYPVPLKPMEVYHKITPVRSI